LGLILSTENALLVLHYGGQIFIKLVKNLNFVIFDLEATCWESDHSKDSEIIEIGAIKLNNKLELIDTFSEFLKPVINPFLSDFCIKLTTINQCDIDNADSFCEVMPKFEKWITAMDNEVILCSWGFYDKKQISKECSFKGYNGEIKKLLNKHISIKHRFAKAKGIEPCGMVQALEILKIPLVGTHHRGIDDAKNITEIFKVVFDELNFKNL
jgi:inhibitor of KinA sporulation pathway (predicted exonuclease)